MVRPSARASAQSVRRSLLSSVGEERASDLPSPELEQLMENLEVLANSSKSLTWHVHLSGYDKAGKVF